MLGRLGRLGRLGWLGWLVANQGSGPKSREGRVPKAPSRATAHPKAPSARPRKLARPL